MTNAGFFPQGIWPRSSTSPLFSHLSKVNLLLLPEKKGGETKPGSKTCNWSVLMKKSWSSQISRLDRVQYEKWLVTSHFSYWRWSYANIFYTHDFKTGQQSAPHIQLEIPRQSQQLNAEKVLVANHIWARLCHIAIEVFRSIFTTTIGGICNCTIITLLDV